MPSDNHETETPGQIMADMSAAAITARLNKAGQLYELSRLLKSAKRIDATTTCDLASSNDSIVAESPPVERQDAPRH